MVAHLAIATVGLAHYLYDYGLRTLDVSAAMTLTLAGGAVHRQAS